MTKAKTQGRVAIPRLSDNEQVQAIADVTAMLGMCATLNGDRTIGEVRGKVQPKSALGAEIQGIVERAIADAKAKREAKRTIGR